MRLFLGGVELSDESRGGDETRHRYQTHSEWHTDSKFVGLLKVGYQTSIIEILQTCYLWVRNPLYNKKSNSLLCSVSLSVCGWLDDAFRSHQ